MLKAILFLAIYWWLWLIPLGICGLLRIIVGRIYIQ